MRKPILTKRQCVLLCLCPDLADSVVFCDGPEYPRYGLPLDSHGKLKQKHDQHFIGTCISDRSQFVAHALTLFYLCVCCVPLLPLSGVISWMSHFRFDGYTLLITTRKKQALNYESGAAMTRATGDKAAWNKRFQRSKSRYAGRGYDEVRAVDPGLSPRAVFIVLLHSRM